MAIMEKRVSSKKMPSKPNKKITKKKNFLKKVVDYLKSDSYLFTSLISSSSNYRSLLGIEIKQKDKKESKKKFVKKVGDYFISNSFMYSPILFVPVKPIHTSPRETQPLIKSVTAVELVRRSISVREKNNLANEVKKGHKSTDKVSKRDVKEQECLVHTETVKSTIYQNFRPSTISEPGSKIRKLL